LNTLKRITKKIYFVFCKISIIKSLYYSIKFKAKIFIGKGTKLNLHKNSKIIVNKGKLFIGCRFSLPFKTVVDIYENGKLIVNGRVEICKGTKVMIGNDAILKIGNNSYINENSRIQCREEIQVGEECAISWNVNILDTDEHILIIDGVKKQSVKKVVIGDKVWIGSKATILKGVEIGNGAVIAAGAFVSKNVSTNCLVGGIPAKTIYENVTWN